MGAMVYRIWQNEDGTWDGEVHCNEYGEPPTPYSLRAKSEAAAKREMAYLCSTDPGFVDVIKRENSLTAQFWGNERPLTFLNR